MFEPTFKSDAYLRILDGDKFFEFGVPILNSIYTGKFVLNQFDSQIININLHLVLVCSDKVAPTTTLKNFIESINNYISRLIVVSYDKK